MEHQIVFLPGDGIGPEVATAARLVLETTAAQFGLGLKITEALIGGAAYDATGTPLPEETLEKCKKASAVFLGAVGGPKWDAAPQGKRPESGLLALRKGLGVFANLRPVSVYPELAGFSCLRSDRIAEGVDLVVVRELTGDIYFGEHHEEIRDNKRYAHDVMAYDEEEISRIAHIGFQTAKTRRGTICSVDKANVLAVSRLWRAVVTEVSREYPDVALEHMYVDNAAMQLVARPACFDVILTGNLFGDILSDLAASLTGSLGMLSSASLGTPGSPGLYEPAHGSAPDIAGRDIANPLASILSVALMLRMSLNAPEAADAVERAVQESLRQGRRTADLISAQADAVPLGCAAMTRQIISLITAKQ